MRFNRNMVYWSMPLVLWLLQYVDFGGMQILGIRHNHNETLVRDRS